VTSVLRRRTGTMPAKSGDCASLSQQVGDQGPVPESAVPLRSMLVSRVLRRLLVEQQIRQPTGSSVLVSVVFNFARSLERCRARTEAFLCPVGSALCESWPLLHASRCPSLPPGHARSGSRKTKRPPLAESSPSETDHRRACPVGRLVEASGPPAPPCSRRSKRSVFHNSERLGLPSTIAWSGPFSNSRRTHVGLEMPRAARTRRVGSGVRIRPGQRTRPTDALGGWPGPLSCYCFLVTAFLLLLSCYCAAKGVHEKPPVSACGLVPSPMAYRSSRLSPTRPKVPWILAHPYPLRFPRICYEINGPVRPALSGNGAQP